MQAAPSLQYEACSLIFWFVALLLQIQTLCVSIGLLPIGFIRKVEQFWRPQEVMRENNASCIIVNGKEQGVDGKANRMALKAKLFSVMAMREVWKF